MQIEDNVSNRDRKQSIENQELVDNNFVLVCVTLELCAIMILN